MFMAVMIKFARSACFRLNQDNIDQLCKQCCVADAKNKAEIRRE